MISSQSWGEPSGGTRNPRTEERWSRTYECIAGTNCDCLFTEISSFQKRWMGLTGLSVHCYAMIQMLIRISWWKRSNSLVLWQNMVNELCQSEFFGAAGLYWEYSDQNYLCADDAMESWRTTNKLFTIFFTMDRRNRMHWHAMNGFP